MTQIYVTRAFGGTFLYTIPPPPVATKVYKLSARVKNELTLTALIKAKLSLVPVEAPLAEPNSTIQVTLTATDIAGSPVTALSALTCIVTFPDGSVSSTYSLGSGIANAGSGNYILVYTTKGPGTNLELWTATDGSGNTAQIINRTPVTY